MLDSLWNDRQCRMLICYPQYIASSLHYYVIHNGLLHTISFEFLHNNFDTAQNNYTTQIFFFKTSFLFRESVLSRKEVYSELISVDMKKKIVALIRSVIEGR